MASQSVDLLYAANSTNRASSVLTMMDFIPRLGKDLQEKPEETLKVFEEIRKYGECYFGPTLPFLIVPISDGAIWHSFLGNRKCRRCQGPT